VQADLSRRQSGLSRGRHPTHQGQLRLSPRAGQPEGHGTHALGRRDQSHVRMEWRSHHAEADRAGPGRRRSRCSHAGIRPHRHHRELGAGVRRRGRVLMPTLLPVKEYEIARETSRLEETRENPTRVFVSIPLATDAAGVTRPIGTAGYYTWQNGHWFDTGGNYIADENHEPQFARDEIAAKRPVWRRSWGPAAAAVWQFDRAHVDSSE